MHNTHTLTSERQTLDEVLLMCLFHALNLSHHCSQLSTLLPHSVQINESVITACLCVNVSVSACFLLAFCEQAVTFSCPVSRRISGLSPQLQGVWLILHRKEV